jgi:hypothetical protein
MAGGHGSSWVRWLPSYMADWQIRPSVGELAGLALARGGVDSGHGDGNEDQTPLVARRQTRRPGRPSRDSVGQVSTRRESRTVNSGS